jgi:hypothetical protein
MQGMFNQCLYQLQTITNLFSSYWVRDKIPTSMEEKKFQILSQKQHVRLAQHTLK